ncbi:hypothetical protein D3C72_2071460 [compost metagenome]
MSVVPPGGYGTMMRTGLAGNSSAPAMPGMVAPNARVPAASALNKCFMQSPVYLMVVVMRLS